MTFFPTLTDYFMLSVFTFLFLLTGWLTHLLVCWGKKGRGDRDASLQESEKAVHLSFSLEVGDSLRTKKAAAPEMERTAVKKRNVYRDLTLLESILSILINGLVVT